MENKEHNTKTKNTVPRRCQSLNRKKGNKTKGHIKKKNEICFFISYILEKLLF